MSESTRKNPKILCFFSNLLGLRTFSDAARSALSESDYDLTFLYVNESDFYARKSCFLERVSNGFEGIRVSREVLRKAELDLASYDVVFVISHHLAAALPKLPNAVRLVVLFDSTPRTAHRAKEVYVRSVLNRVGSLGSRFLDWVYFKPMFERADYLLAVTENARQSAVSEYGVRADRINILILPIEIQAPRKRRKTKINYLFVGNDFDRKGGPFLVEMFNRYLRSSGDLTIVSGDPAAKLYSKINSVTILGNMPRQDLMLKYTEADLLLFPTLRDDLGLVICEAISSGLPVVTRNAGAQGEWVKSGFNGCLMDYEANAQDWAREIRKIATDPELLAKYSTNCLKLAKERVGLAAFRNQLFCAIGNLESGRR